MKEIIINEKRITFKNPNQIINMGGPWVGKLFLNDDELTDNVIIDNLLYKEDEKRLYFVRYQKGSRWKKNNYFTVSYLDLSNNTIHAFESKFKILFIKNITNNGDLIYYEAFHDKDENKKARINDFTR
jgi:hypothetical protein